MSSDPSFSPRPATGAVATGNISPCQTQGVTEPMTLEYLSLSITTSQPVLRPLARGRRHRLGQISRHL